MASTPSSPARLPPIIAAYAGSGKNFSVLDFCWERFPDNALGAFVRGDLLQVVVFALLFGLAVIGMGERGHSG